jgi:uncharacterized membrane protein HdeD (DUF308 family)
MTAVDDSEDIELTAHPRAPPDEAGMDWRVVLVGGLAVSSLGILAIILPWVASFAIDVVLGFTFAASGIALIATSWANETWAGRIPQLVVGAVMAFSGGLFIVRPEVGLATLTVLLTILLVTYGVVQIAAAIRMRGEPNWTGILGAGVLALAVGLFVWLRWPASAEWALGLLAGLAIFGTGLSILGLALGRRSERKRQKRRESAVPPRGA